jgi:hypothetical protein
MSMKSEVDCIIKSLFDRGIINLTKQDISRMKGTTDGLVYTLSESNQPKYVLKMDQPQQITFTEHFLHVYNHVKLFPKILYTDPEKRFMVYSFIKGTTHYNRGSKLNWMTLLVKELFNHYVKYDVMAKWGRLGLPRQSWHEFNTYSVEQARINLGSILPSEDFSRVKFLVKNISKWEKQEDRYLLHGDTGVHNFVFHDSTLVGIIDPSPMVGPLIYDFTYAFCSSPEDLDMETLFATFSLLKDQTIDQDRLIEEMIVQLYTRIGICAKHHPQDLEDYLKAWDYWSVLIPY